MVPKMVKNVGILGVLLVTWTMWRAGGLVPFINEYSPEEFVAPRPDYIDGPQFIAEVIVDPETVYRTAFDGVEAGGVLGPFFASGGFTSPPDSALCVVTLEARRPECRFRMSGDRPLSYCQDAFICSWTFEQPSGRAFGLVLLDIDPPDSLGGGWDLIDATLVLNGPSPEDVQALDHRMRLFIGYVAPTELVLVKPQNGLGDGIVLEFNRPERERREAPLTYFTPAELEAGVTLAQSQLRLAFFP